MGVGECQRVLHQEEQQIRNEAAITTMKEKRRRRRLQLQPDFNSRDSCYHLPSERGPSKESYARHPSRIDVNTRQSDSDPEQKV